MLSRDDKNIYVHHSAVFANFRSLLDCTRPFLEAWLNKVGFYVIKSVSNPTIHMFYSIFLPMTKGPFDTAYPTAY